MVRFSDQLIDYVRGVKNQMLVDYARLDAVIRVLCFQHDACVASERLLERAAERSTEKLKEYYVSHLAEESGEIGVLTEDLASVGVTQWQRAPVAMAMIGSQYYMIEHLNPVMLLGYMSVQEAIPTPIEVVEQLEAMHGENLFRFVRMHAVRDVDHKEELLRVIDEQEEALQPLIWYSAENTLMYLAMVTKTFGV